MDGSNESPPPRTRRRFLEALVAGTSGAFAGCGFDATPGTDSPSRDRRTGSGSPTTGRRGADGGTTPEPTAGPANGTAATAREVHDARLRVADPLGLPPTERHCNPFNPRRSGCLHPGLAVFDPPVVYSASTHGSTPLVASDWRLSGERTLDVEFGDEWTWHDGDPVVAEDYVAQQQIDLEIRRFRTDPDERAHPAISSVEAVDDGLARFTLHEPLAESFAVQWALATPFAERTRSIYVKHDDPQWREWRDALRNRSGDEKARVVSEVTESRYPRLDGDSVVGNGPFRVATVSDDRVVLQRYDDHPHADATDFETVSFVVDSDRSAVELYAAGEADAALEGFPASAAERGGRDTPRGHELVGGGWTANSLLSFNCGHGVDHETPFDDRRVRQAMCHLFDRAALKERLDGPARPFGWAPCRVPGPVLASESHDIAGFVRENCVRYGGNDTDRAGDLLRAAGYERVDGSWYTPGGERFVVEVTNGERDPAFATLGDALESFGIGVDWLRVSTFDQRRREGDYHLLPDDSSARGVTQMWLPGLITEWLPSILHFDTETTIPMPIGDPEGASGEKSIDVGDHVRQWFHTGESRLHRELVWWWNQAVPQMEVSYRPDAGAIDGRRWDVDLPSSIELGVRYPLYRALGWPSGGVRYESE